MKGLADFLKSLGPSLPSVAVLGGVLYWVLQKKMEAALTRRLGITKHELQMQYQKHQKDSFRNVLVAMNQAIEAIASGGDEEWHPIEESDVDTFRRVVSEEAMFLDTASDHALRIFVEAMRDAVQQPFEPPPEQEAIRRAHSQTAFVSERISDHFRSRVGLAPAQLNSLYDVELLGACRLINRYHFPKCNLPTNGLAFLRWQTASELVATAKLNADQLRTELERLKEAIRSDERRARFFFSAGADADRYLQMLRRACATRRDRS